jgi:hypothetical protein
VAASEAGPSGTGSMHRKRSSSPVLPPRSRSGPDHAAQRFAVWKRSEPGDRRDAWWRWRDGADG